MDRRYQKGFVASSSSSSTAKSSISGETDENETILLDLVDFKSQSCKKTLVHKHFMPPTLSAKTKPSIPSKKILSDINEQPPPLNSYNLEDGDAFYTERSSIQSVLANYCSSESDGDEHHSTYASKPYDPLTNYLSPRPKYLRYNPNRRRKICVLEESGQEKKDSSKLPPASHFASQKFVDEQDLLQESGDSVISLAQKQVIKVEDDASLPPVSSFVSQNVVDEDESSMEGNSKAIKPDTLVFPAQGDIAKPGDQKQLGKVDDGGNNDDDGSVNQDNREELGKIEDDCNDNDDDEDEEGNEENQEEGEFEEERRCSLKGIVVMFILFSLIAFSYMSSMNNVGDKLQKHSLGNYSLNVQQEAQMDFVKLNLGNSFPDFRGGHRVSQDVDDGEEMTDEISQSLQPQNIWNKHAYDPSNELSNKLSDAKSLEIKNVDTSDEMTEISDHSQLSEIPEFGFETFPELEEGSGMTQLPRCPDHDDFTEEKNEPLDSERIVMHLGKGIPSEKETDAELIHDVNELLEIHQNKQGGEVVLQKGEDIVDIDPIEDTGKIMEEPRFSRQEPMTESVQDETSQPIVMYNTGQTGSIEDAGKSIEDTTSGSQETTKDNLHHGSDQSALMENNFTGCDEIPTEANFMTLGGIAPAYIVVSLLVLALPFLVYMYAPWAINGPVKRSKQVTVPVEESSKIFKSNQAPVSVDMKHMRLKPPTAQFLSQEAVQENSYVQAPNVEFLGELVIDEVYSSHRRSGGYKNDKTTDSNHAEKITKNSCVDVIDEVYSSHKRRTNKKSIDSNHMEKKSRKGSYVDVIDEVYKSHRSGNKHDNANDSNHLEKNTKGSYDDVNVYPSCSIASSYSSIEESTTAESPSNGSFTAGKKISKKQGDRTVATPVRRSTRIRNLKFASP